MGQLLIWICTNQITSWLLYRWSIFGAQINHEHRQTHKTHYDLDLGEATTFSLIFSMTNHGGYTQMSFSLGFESLNSRN